MLKTTKILAGLSAVAVLGVSMLPMSAYADTETETSVKVTVGTAVSIAVDKSDVSANIIAGSDVDKSMATNVTVTTNTGGYMLTINGKDGNTSLTNGSVTIDTGIPAKGSSAWGYSLDGGNTANEIPASATMVKEYTGATSNDVTTITFPTSVKSDQTPGEYNGTVVFTVTAKNQFTQLRCDLSGRLAKARQISPKYDNKVCVVLLGQKIPLKPRKNFKNLLKVYSGETVITEKKLWKTLPKTLVKLVDFPKLLTYNKNHKGHTYINK